MRYYIRSKHPDSGEYEYLNHSQLNTMSFGSRDMAWFSNSISEACIMIDKIRENRPEDKVFIFSEREPFDYEAYSEESWLERERDRTKYLGFGER